ncbi:MAG TPA: metal-dependent hydrolase [Lysobacter sp.]|jgi:inner membrane protein|nr:metal-dependent hydrolase [Lysobacter sp.]
MPTVITHAVVPLVIGTALGKRTIQPRLMLAGAFVAMLPDFDVIAFKLGIAYADTFGHRGASHSLLFAACVGFSGVFACRALRSPVWLTFVWLFACTASHPLLDAFTDGGLGVALLWPWHDARLFAPWRPIEVSPIGASFFSARGLAVLWSEVRWVWLPALAVAAFISLVRNRRRTPPAVS